MQPFDSLFVKKDSIILDTVNYTVFRIRNILVAAQWAEILVDQFY